MENNMNATTGIIDVLIDAINKKYDNIRDLNSLNINLEEENYEDMIPVIDSIVENENNNIGKLQQLIDLLSGSEENIEEGKQDTLEILDNSEFVESITTMKNKKLRLSENFDNVIDDVQAVASPTFVGANKEHDENKKKYEDAMEENKKAAEETIPDEGDTGKKVKSKALKSMHLSEKLFEDVYDSVEEEVEDFILDKISQLEDNLAMVVSYKVKGYNPEWCEAIVGDHPNLEKKLMHAQMNYIDALMGVLFAEKDSLTEDLSFDNYSDFNSEVYNAISEVCFNFQEKGLSQKDIEAALEWFETHFFDSGDFEEENVIEESWNNNEFHNNKWDIVVTAKYGDSMDRDILLNGTKVGELWDDGTIDLKKSISDEDKKELLRLTDGDLLHESCAKELKESYVAEWWGQVDGDTPQSVAKRYNLTVKPIKKRRDEILYRFDGNLDDFSRAMGDGYFYSLTVQQDAGHSEDINSLLYESIQYNIAKEQIKKFTEGKMPKNWSVNYYLKKLVEDKHINRKEAKSLKEWYSRNK